MRDGPSRRVAGILAGALIACCSSALAQPAPAPPDPAPPAPAPARCDGELHVHAVDVATHEAVGYAAVRVNGVHAGDTDASGHLAVHRVCPGAVAIEVERADYLLGERTLTIDGHSDVEVELVALDVETVVLEERAPAPVDMRSTTVLEGAALERTRGRGFAEALAEVPGVTQLRSATGMAKPIVRGQYGRRLVLLVDGVRHRAQEWGLDHAPEIDPFTAARITVVRGAAGVRHGPDAIGGAILAEPPELPRTGLGGELHLVGMTNGAGGSVAGRVHGATARWPGLAWRIEGSRKQLAAPRTPDYALDNSGVREWNLGGALGYRRGDAEYRLAVSHYDATLGVCGCLRIDSPEDFYAQLERARPIGSEHFRADFAIDRPRQEVGHDLALARARWRLDRGALTATYAFQRDRRREYDVVRMATTGPQFDFDLVSHDAEVAFDHDPFHLGDHLHLRGAAGAVAGGQLHGYQGLSLVPDYRAVGAGAYLIERLIGHDFELEAGVRYDLLARSASIERIDFLRLVRSGQLAMDACGDASGEQIACASTYHTLSASLGGLYQLTPAWSAKLDLSTASRPPNPDEQYLNGTSPTFPILALGKPDLGPETTWSAAATTSYRGARVAAELSGYVNRIDGYLELAPAIGADGRPIFDVLIRGAFPRFTTRAVDALFYGADGGVAYVPWPTLELGAQVSIVRGRRGDGGALVFVPPDRARATVTVKPPATRGPLRAPYVTLDGTYVARQRRYDVAADLAPPPPAYFLLGAEAGVETTAAGEPMTIALTATNLLNRRYRDYTSLLRYFADQPGWQLFLRVSLHLDSR